MEETETCVVCPAVRISFRCPDCGAGACSSLHLSYHRPATSTTGCQPFRLKQGDKVISVTIVKYQV